MADTLHRMFIESAQDAGSNTAYIQRFGDEWKHMSFADALAQTEKVGAGLIDLGVKSGDRVSILSMSRQEWAIADYAILGAGATSVPIYQTSSADECCFILDNSSASVLFVEDMAQLKKIRSVRKDLPKLHHIIVFDPSGIELDEESGELSWDALAKRSGNTKTWHEAGEKVAAKDIATIIYTSGTTGPPKGCILSHHNYVFMTKQGIDQTVGLFSDNDRIVLFLPMAHTFARLTHFAASHLKAELAFTTIATLMDDLGELKPTLMPSVPRVFEKAYTRILGQFNEATGAKRALIDRAMKIGAKRGRYVQRGRRVPPVIAAQHAVFHKLVFSKIHARFGGNMRLFISGGAPLSREVGEFFLACGITICEGYGLTESTTAMSVNHPNDFRLGSVGKVFNGTKVKIASDGEILVKGDIVFQGYYGNEAATKEVLSDGWLHTGDIGDFDREGFLYITDRKKDLIVTAGGKNIAPANIENALKATQYISQACAYGDKKPYITALITLDPDEIANFATANDLSGDIYAWVAEPKVHDLIKQAVDHVNANLGRVEQVKRFRILPIDFTTETGELTPSLKMKRKVILERYGQWIDEMYVADATPIAGLSDPRIAALQDTPKVNA